jgi:hypothetical protein
MKSVGSNCHHWRQWWSNTSCEWHSQHCDSIYSYHVYFSWSQNWQNIWLDTYISHFKLVHLIKRKVKWLFAVLTALILYMFSCRLSCMLHGVGAWDCFVHLWISLFCQLTSLLSCFSYKFARWISFKLTQQAAAASPRFGGTEETGDFRFTRPGTMTFICLVKMYEKLVGETLRLTWFFHVLTSISLFSWFLFQLIQQWLNLI